MAESPGTPTEYLAGSVVRATFHSEPNRTTHHSPRRPILTVTSILPAVLKKNTCVVNICAV
jgi:hypothetical protein